MLLAILTLVASYFVGAIPFGWLIARARGVDIFHAGSGNIGATNVGRVLGRKFGLLVFVLDFMKGAGPVLLTGLLPSELHEAFGLPNALRVGSAVCAFLGHLFPIYLRFRGGKGVATGAGTVFVLMPGPMALACLAWAAATASSRMVSLGSLAAVAMLCAARLLSVRDPFAEESIVITLFCIGGSALLVLKHFANVKRILKGTENRLEDKPMFRTVVRGIHVLAVGLWFGAMVMFNFIVVPAQFFEAFPAVVKSAPSDRTANLPIAAGATESQKKDLANALAGSAVGPVFPKFFQLQAVCACLGLITAFGWRKQPGKVHRLRVVVLSLAALTIVLGWPISNQVSALRIERFHPDSVLAEVARSSFAEWHFVSLGLSLVTVTLVGLALALAARMPDASQR